MWLYLCVFALLGRLAECQWELVWEDDFSNGIDPNKWVHEITAAGGGNGEFQLYGDDPENSFVRNGALHIRPTLLADKYGHDFMYNGVLNVWDIYGGRCTAEWNDGCYRTGYNVPGVDIPPAQSARLRTYERFSWLYGAAEFDAKMPVGDWLWPAIWMLPEDWEYGDWPQSGEVDIIESIGNRDFRDNNWNYKGIQHMDSTLHWGYPDMNKFWLTAAGRHDYDRNYGDHFHTYRVEWSSNGFMFFVDGAEIARYPTPLIDQHPGWNGWWWFGEVNGGWGGYQNPGWGSGSNSMAPFDKAFHFIVNVAVGGTNWYIPDGLVNKNGWEGCQKMWHNGQDYQQAMRAFYEQRWCWYEDWENEAAQNDNDCMKINHVRVYRRV